MPVTQRIAPCPWCDHQAEEAAALYVSIFKNSKLSSISRSTSPNSSARQLGKKAIRLAP
jgi:predicted 3-demethylubiquinone-9 3-methyltransferase (glyoxalase superfamily)